MTAEFSYEQDYFQLFEFSAKWDPIPTMLTQNHTRLVKGFYGQTTSYKSELIKPDVLILGENKSLNEVRYIHSTYGKGFWTFYSGHDPEDYQHTVGEQPTDLNLHPNSPGYRLILNNILFPAAKKKKAKDLMRFGLISDTHSYLLDEELHHFDDCDEIWHAGDIGNISVLEKLESYKRTVAVYGNIDDAKVRRAVPEIQKIRRAGQNILMIHIAGKPPYYTKRVKDLVEKLKPNILVCGHSHILKVEMDKKNKVLYINPGAAGIHGFHKVRTIIKFSIEKGIPKDMVVIELGLRSKSPVVNTD